MRIILASGSPRRKELLSQVGIDYEVITSNVDETVGEMLPSEVVEVLSLRKAKSVYDSLEGDVLVIGADTVVALDHMILGKPENAEHAQQMLASLAGRAHSVYTGVTLILRENGKENIITFHNETKVYVDEMTDDDISKYVQTGDCMDKAGAYGIQGYFAAFVEKIEGDYNNVVGLPVEHICRELRRMGLK